MWSVRKEADKTTCWNNICIINEKGLVVANVVMQFDDSEMRIARLIAAAPDLLEALKKARRFVVSSNDPLGSELDEIDAAIAKAEG